jgi:ribosome-binding factor A
MSHKNWDHDRAQGARRHDEDEFANFFKDSRKKRQDHKTAQLCRQVHRTLIVAMSALPEEALLELSVLDVRPAPDASTLAVVLQKRSDTLFSSAQVYEALERMRGRLRTLVTQSIHRKRAPELTFVLVGSEEVRS